MGLFSGKPKPRPVVRVNGLKLWFDTSRECPEFFYRHVHFSFSGAEFHCPKTMELDGVLATVEALLPEMR